LATAGTAVNVKKRSRRIGIVLLVLVLLAATGLLSFYFHPGFFLGELQRFRAWRMGLQPKSVVLRGQKIHYIVGGAGKPLVLVHGLAGRSEDWFALIPQLVDNGYKVYALDLLGYGQSARPDVDYSISLEEEIVKDFLDSQGLREPDMAGWSMGGWISLKFAADHPERVHKLILLDSAGLKFDAVNVPLLRPKTEADLARMMQVLTPHPPHIPSFYAADLLRDFATEDWIIDRALKSMYTGKDLLDGRLSTIKTPVLLVWGKQDVLTPLAMGEQMHNGIPRSELKVFEGCGHLAPVECSGEVGRAMIEFLNQADASEQRSTQKKYVLVPGRQ
jgi:pimeloyl-ACP methyl ester carboxylesterase